MLRIKPLTNLLATTYAKPHYLLVERTNAKLPDLVSRCYSSKKDDTKSSKVGNVEEETSTRIEQHPKIAEPDYPSSDPPARKFKKPMLKECSPIEINPCKPFDYSRIQSIQKCPTPNLMSELPQPECNWKEHDRNNRKRYKRVLLFGILFTAFTLGAVNYLGLTTKTKDKVKPKVKRSAKKTSLKVPLTSDSIPKKVPYLLIGGGTASFSAFRAIKSADPTAKVLVVSSEPFFPYMRPPLSKEIWFNDDKETANKLIFKQWNGSERSLYYEPEDFYTNCQELMSSEHGGVAVAKGWTVTELDVVEKRATLDDGAVIEYEKCLIATGATPKSLPVFQAAADANAEVSNRIKLYRNIDDFRELNEVYAASKSIAIVGGGFLGSELACALARKDKKNEKQIYQLFRENGNMGKILPEYLSSWTTEKVKGEGVNVLSQTEVTGVRGDKTGLELSLSDGKTVQVDQAIIAIGVEPNTDLAQKSDLEVDPELGGYLVNTELQARSNLYIAGDCACFYDARLGRRRIEHHDHAVVSGRLAGENMAGGAKPYLHQSMFWSDLGPDVGYEAIGIIDSSLPTVGVFAKATSCDNPKAVTGEGVRSEAEEEEDDECKNKKVATVIGDKSNEAQQEDDDYGKGVVFYLRDEIVVGIVLWNVFNRMSIARQVLKDQRKYDDLNEVAKLFNIHEE